MSKRADLIQTCAYPGSIVSLVLVHVHCTIAALRPTAAANPCILSLYSAHKNPALCTFAEQSKPPFFFLVFRFLLFLSSTNSISPLCDPLLAVFHFFLFSLSFLSSSLFFSPLPLFSSFTCFLTKTLNLLSKGHHPPHLVYHNRIFPSLSTPPIDTFTRPFYHYFFLLQALFLQLPYFLPFLFSLSASVLLSRLIHRTRTFVCALLFIQQANTKRRQK